MKIVVDANEAFRGELTGIGMYARNLVTQLSKLESDHDISYLAMRSSNCDMINVNGKVVRLLRSYSNRTWWSQVRIPLHFLRHKYNIFHSLDHKLPLFSNCKNVITIYDLAFFKFPETVDAMHLLRYKWFTMDAIRRATRIIAISKSTKDDICQMFRISEDKVDVVHLGVDQSLYHEKGLPENKKTKYLLSVGTLQPRKNYVMLIRAFNRACAGINEPLELLIVGKRGWLWHDTLNEAARSPYRDRIHFLGYVPEKDMPSLYEGAEVFVMPSLYEGFGIPSLEAMACGVPVVLSNCSSLPEVADDAGILLDPTDELLWASTIQRLINDRALRTVLKERGLKRVTQFSWEKTARETLSVYQRVGATKNEVGRVYSRAHENQ